MSLPDASRRSKASQPSRGKTLLVGCVLGWLRPPRGDEWAGLLELPAQGGSSRGKGSVPGKLSSSPKSPGPQRLGAPRFELLTSVALAGGSQFARSWRPHCLFRCERVRHDKSPLGFKLTSPRCWRCPLDAHRLLTAFLALSLSHLLKEALPDPSSSSGN